MKKKIIMIDDIEIDEEELDEAFKEDGDEAPVAADDIDLVNKLVDECKKLLE